jgi:hypothetical protein
VGKVKPFCRAWKYFVTSGTAAEAKVGKKRLMIDIAFGNGSESFEVWAQA